MKPKNNKKSNDCQLAAITFLFFSFNSLLDQHPAPKLWVNPEIKNFYDFKVEDFKLEGYEYEPLEEKIPVAI